jgi:formylmethanofuran dehydrogenase subunit E
MKEKIINNVQCSKCKYWGWIEWFEKKEEGYICDDCLEKMKR